MKIIIAGAGEVGTYLAKMLSNEQQDIILLDSNQQQLDLIDSNYNLMTYNGSTSSMSTMKELGISSTDLYVAVTPYESRNITSCAIAKKLGAKKTVARIDNYEFLLPKNTQLLNDLGVDRLIYPELLAAEEINMSLSHNWARYWGELHGGELLMIGVKLHQGSPLINLMLMELPVENHDFHVAAIKRHNETIIPTGKDRLKLDDIVYFITTPEYIEKVRELCGKKKRVIKKAFIFGASRIAIRFAKEFHELYQLKIVDDNLEKCEQLATDLPDIEVIHGDGRDIDILRENNIYQSDAFLALTESSEANILACLMAKEFGIQKTVADVENIQFLSQAENLNIGTTINKKLLASSRIFKILLAADESNSKFLTLADAEIAEIQVKYGAKITKGMVKDLNLPYGITLAALVRDNHCQLVSGMTKIEPGDFVVVFCLTGMLRKLEKWFG